MPAPTSELPDLVARRTAAEDEIRRILLDLADATGRRIDQVEVDTRNFANYQTTIFLVAGR